MKKQPSDENDGKALGTNTRLVTGGRDPQSQYGFVNPAVYHASTVLYPTARDLLEHRGRYQYGRRGTPTSEALEEALRGIEGERCKAVSLLPSGMAAISTALLAVVKAGDHLLVADNVYRPTRVFCDKMLTRLGVTITYFDPADIDGLRTLMRPETRAVFIETPGSQSLEMTDVRAIVEVAQARDALVLTDNTWATPLYFPALDFGIDLSIQAATKYIGGHSDIMLGTVSANTRTAAALKDTVATLGLCVGPDDIFLGLRGLRTLGVRLAHHQAAGIRVAEWLKQRPEVLRVLHPALHDDPGHQLWKRDFRGASGLFSVVLEPAPEAAVHAFLDSLKLFGMGFSWGGYESLVIPFDCSEYRTVTRWNPGGPTLRMSIGLEDVDDLLADLAQGFEAMRAAA